MKAYRIQIIKAKLDSYWYASCTGNTYWAVIEEDRGSYTVIEEGAVRLGDLGTKWVDYDDVLVLKEATIEIESSVTVKVVELMDLK